MGPSGPALMDTQPLYDLAPAARLITRESQRLLRIHDIEALLARELGTGLNVVLVRMDGERIPLTLAPTATVRDLKQLIKRVMSARLEKEAVMGKRKVSWKSVWTDFCLMHNGQRLLEDGARLCDVGVATDSDIAFARFNAKKAVKDARPRREKRPRRNAGDQ